MRHLILLMTLMTAVSFASAHTVESCLDTAHEHYELSRNDRDVHFSIDLRNTASNIVDNKLIYEVTGSEHSGWFMDRLVLNAEDCSLISIQNVYSE